MQTARARQEQPVETEADKQLHEEEDILKHVTQKTALKTAKELAKVRCCRRMHQPLCGDGSGVLVSRTKV